MSEAQGQGEGVLSDDLYRELQQLQQYAAALNGLLTDAQSKAPKRSQAEDSSGAVTMVLDGSGLPEEIRLAQDWQRRLEPGALGAAVVDAFAQAAQARVSAWGRTLEGGEWGDKVSRMMAADAQGRGPMATSEQASEVPPLFRRDQATVKPRPVEELAEDMIKAFDNVDAYASASSLTKEFEGTNGARTVTVKLSQAGLAACTVDGGWAAGQPATVLSNALGDALASARAKLRAAADEPSPTGKLDSLFDEAIALLNDPRRLAGS